MPIEFRCVQCNKLLRTPDDSAGKTGQCPHCQTRMEIPKPPPKPVSDDLFGAPPADPPPLDYKGPGEPMGAAPAPNVFSDSYGERMYGPAGYSPYSSSPGVGYGYPTAPSAGYGYPAAHYRPHRGAMILTFGIISTISAAANSLGCLCCFFWIVSIPAAPLALGLGIPAWVMGQADLHAMKSGYMDPSGHGITMTGYIMGIVGVALVALGAVGFLISFVFGFANAAINNASGF